MEDAELKELHDLFQKVQAQDATARLSERVAVELTLKLIATGRVDLIYTQSGREYLTKPRLRHEVEEEVIAHGGRVSVVDLQPLIGVDMSHIEAAVAQLVASRPRWSLVQGAIITSQHLDELMEEANERLQAEGKVALSALAQQFSLPLDVVREAAAFHVEAGTIDGVLRDGELYTETFVERHRARVRGAFAAATEPVTVRSLVARHGLNDVLADADARALVAAGALAGVVQRTSYHPALHSRSQEAGVRSFYEQNGFVSYDFVSQLRVSGKPEPFLRRILPAGGVYLGSCYLGEAAVAAAAATADEAAASGAIVDLAPLFPGSLSDADLARAAAHASDGCKASVMASRFVVPEAALADALERLRPRVAAMAASDDGGSEGGGGGGGGGGDDDEGKYGDGANDGDDAADASAAAAPSSSSKKGKKGKKKGRKKDDEWDDDDDGGGGGGKGTASAAAAAPAKMSKKAKRKAKEAAAAAQSGETGGGGKKAAAGKKRKQKDALLTLRRVGGWVREELGGAMPDDDALVEAVAQHLLPRLARALLDARKTIATGGASDKRKRRDELAAQVQELSDSVSVFYRASQTLGEGAARVEQHLLRTLGARALDVLLELEASHSGLRRADGSEAVPGPSGAFSDEERAHLVRQAGDASAALLSELYGSLSAKTAERFAALLPRVADACGARVRPMDRKRERNTVFSMRRAMISQLESEQRPEAAVQYAALIAHSQARGVMLHAKGRSTPDIVESIRDALTEEAHATLAAAAASAREYLSAKREGREEDAQRLGAELSEQFDAVKAIGLDPKAAMQS